MAVQLVVEYLGQRIGRVENDDVAERVFEKVVRELVPSLQGYNCALPFARRGPRHHRDGHAQQVEAVASHVGAIVAAIDPSKLVQVVYVSLLFVELDRRFDPDPGLPCRRDEVVDVRGQLEEPLLKSGELRADIAQQRSRVSG